MRQTSGIGKKIHITWPQVIIEPPATVIVRQLRSRSFLVCFDGFYGGGYRIVVFVRFEVERLLSLKNGGKTDVQLTMTQYTTKGPNWVHLRIKLTRHTTLRISTHHRKVQIGCK